MHNDSSISMTLESLRLYPGATMYLQSKDDGLQTRHKVQFIGIIKGKSLLVTLPFEHGQGMWIQSGHSFIVRGFNGIYAYAFIAQALRTRAHPYAYIHLSWPREIDCQMIRKSLREEVHLPGKVILPDGRNIDVTLLDLSAIGSMLDTRSELGAVGDHAKIHFSVDFEGEETELELPITIRNIHTREDQPGLHIGVGFEGIAKNDALILHCYINDIALGANLHEQS